MRYLLPTANDPGRRYNEFKIDSDLLFTEVAQRNKANIGKPLSQRVELKPLGHQKTRSDSANRVSSWRQSQSDSQAINDEPEATVDLPAAQKTNDCEIGNSFALPPHSSQASTTAQDMRVEKHLLQMV